MNEHLHTKKSLGQHWLSDPNSLQAICDAANLTSSDTVLEIGPGNGSLTQQLTKQVREVIAVELDLQLANELAQRVPVANLKVIHQDILSFDLTTLPTVYKIVANIPYYLTSNLIRVLSESANPPQLAVLLVQKEVAQRVIAKPGKLSLLGISAQFYWEVSAGRVITSKLFTPPPKVDSQILILKHRSIKLFPDINPKTYFRIIKAGFSGRRKKLLNSLSNGLKLPKAAVAEFLHTAGVNPNDRAQNLSLDDWYRVYRTIYSNILSDS